MGVQVKGRNADTSAAGTSGMTARELICARAAQEFDQRFSPSGNATGKILRIERPQFANLNFITQCALEGFKNKAFALHVDGRVAHDLDQVFQVGSVTQIDFIAKTSLVAG